MVVDRKELDLSPGVTAEIVTVAVVLAMVALLVVSCGKPIADHSAPQPVHDRVVQALQGNDAGAIYDELSPATQQSFPREQFLANERNVTAAQGPVTSVQLLEPLTIKTGAEWNGEWAETKVQITRGTTVETYVARYHLEEGQWYLVGTIKVP